jgi:myo-inositol 2-dehydrogenase/D-chiro-inositol 1-dehydrogenase
MNATGKTRVAIVGTGRWGWQHARVFAAHPDAELCGVCGRDAVRAQARAAEFAVRAYTGIGAMIAAERPDLVTLSLPNQEHFAATREVIRAGVPLLVEKPLVFDLGEADQLLSEAASRSLFFAINFNHRYAKPVQLARQAIASGRLGRLNFATWRFGGEGDSDHAHANLIETQCHGFDQLEFLCGPIDALQAEMTAVAGKRGLTTMAISLRFAGGAVGSMVGSYDSSYAYPGTHRVEINGERGRLVIDDTVRRFTFNAAGSETAEVWEAGYFNDRDREFYRTFDAHADAVLAALRAGGAPPVHAAAGRRALALADAAIRSHATGMRISCAGVQPASRAAGSAP